VAWVWRRLTHAVFVVAVSTTAVVTASAAVPALADPGAPGIDVSKYQGRIDWPAVASSPVRFAIMRATLGNRYRDGRYAQNLAGATESGLVVGAYHFAKPSLAPRDPGAEADHFLRVAQVASGDVVPVLDIEETGGLSPMQLRVWARAWLARVHSRTGVRAMIYSGNYFWRGFMRNTSWFGERGHPLWVAHWNVNAPEVPGDRWAGNGYTIWQWSATGKIPGIKGDVDRDWVNGDLVQGTIASLSVLPAEGGLIVGDRIACGGPHGRCFRLANPEVEITLRATPDAEMRLIRWTGACEPAGEARTCVVAALGAKTVSAVFGQPVQVTGTGSEGGSTTPLPTRVGCPIPCSAPSLAGTLGEVSPSDDPIEEEPVSEEPAPGPPSEEWAPDDPVSRAPLSRPDGKTEACRGMDPDCAVAVLQARQRGVVVWGSPARPAQESDGTRYSWSRERDRRAIGGSFRWERRASAAISYRFSGGAATLFTVEGPGMGKARVKIDGERVAWIDGYARTFRSQVRHRFSELGAGAHTLTITPLGKQRRAATDRRVVVDALRWGGRLHPDPKPEAVSWARVNDPSASEGGYVVSDAPGAEAKLSFSGTGLVLRAVRGPARGRAQIWLDGTLVRTVDLYAPTRRFASIHVASGLAHGSHVARVVVLGTHRHASQGSAVTIDRWVVAEGPPSVKAHANGRHGKPPYPKA